MSFLLSYFKRWLEHHNSYGRQVSSHDLIKALAVIIMVCDHIGAYFFPDSMWWRAVGRIGFPVWFFMAGYAARGSYSWSLIPGIATLVLARHFILGTSPFAINALLTIFAIRAMILYIPPKYEKQHWPMALIICALAAVMFQSTSEIFEYGSIGLLFGYLGYMRKNNEDSWQLRILGMGAYTAFISTQLFVLRFDQPIEAYFSIPQAVIVVAGTAWFMHWLYYFTTTRYAGSENWPVAGPLLRALGRHTLLIYVLHLCLFSIILAALRP